MTNSDIVSRERVGLTTIGIQNAVRTWLSDIIARHRFDTTPDDMLKYLFWRGADPFTDIDDVGVDATYEAVLLTGCMVYRATFTSGMRWSADDMRASIEVEHDSRLRDCPCEDCEQSREESRALVREEMMGMHA
ncbi:MAG: hypothetical protein FWD75_03215 [Propionibacteriaceae bacterium]|nr:hypothetical protein [Propionibacteriaceae bacterium]